MINTKKPIVGRRMRGIIEQRMPQEGFLSKTQQLLSENKKHTKTFPHLHEPLRIYCCFSPPSSDMLALLI